MKRKLVVRLGMLVTGLLAVAAWLIPLVFGRSAPPAVAKAVVAVVQRSVAVDYQVAHTLDLAPLAAVYINDPRGGSLDPRTVAFIQSVRPAENPPTDQPGWLDYQQALYARPLADWANALALLRAKQTAGLLTNDEQQILNVVDGTHLIIPTPTPPPITPPPTPSAAMVQTQLAAAYPPGYPMPAPQPTALPTPTTAPVPAYPGDTRSPTAEGSNPLPEPTVLPLPPLPFHGPDPAQLPPSVFAITVLSVRMQGEVVKAYVEWQGAVIEYRLVNVGGQWYIAGETVIRRGPCCG